MSLLKTSSHQAQTFTTAFYLSHQNLKKSSSSLVTYEKFANTLCLAAL